MPSHVSFLRNREPGIFTTHTGGPFVALQYNFPHGRDSHILITDSETESQLPDDYTRHLDVGLYDSDGQEVALKEAVPADKLVEVFAEYKARGPVLSEQIKRLNDLAEEWKDFQLCRRMPPQCAEELLKAGEYLRLSPMIPLIYDQPRRMVPLHPWERRYIEQFIVRWDLG